MTEYNEKEDRVSANNWWHSAELLHELDALSFAFASLRPLLAKGSCEAEIFENASKGFRYRVDYLHDSMRRVLREAKR